MHPQCDICGGLPEAIVQLTPKYSLVRCRVCRLIYTSPMPSDCELADYYTSFHSPDIEQETFTHGAAREPLHRDACSEIRSRVPLGRKHLDIGAGMGFFVKFMAAAGYESSGLEPSVRGVEFARETLGVNVVSEELDTYAPGTQKFDVVTMLDVLEHMTRPKDALQKVKSLLAANGLFVCTVPNAAFALFWITLGQRIGLDLRPESPTIKSISVGALGVPYHLHFFTPTTLRFVLEHQGLQVEVLRTPAVVKSSRRIRTLAKYFVRFGADLVYALTNKKTFLGYSILAVARANRCI
jgi:SAM-dependent methyltransferase